MFTFKPQVLLPRPAVTIPVGLVSSRYLYDAFDAMFAAIRWHIHTLILFTYTDYKTIFIPVVSIPHPPSLSLVLLLNVVDRVCSSRCPCAFATPPVERCSMDMAAPPPVQRVESIQDP